MDPLVSCDFDVLEDFLGANHRYDSSDPRNEAIDHGFILADQNLVNVVLIFFSLVARVNTQR